MIKRYSCVLWLRDKVGVGDGSWFCMIEFADEGMEELVGTSELGGSMDEDGESGGNSPKSVR